ncbi:hypothetical protein AB1Y20_020682 [Prymnesium parvum]|uniref:Glycosyltransferase 2-like domain-containing protein n=1 Tax=Prymnesium parvum TaxID=97485 RepID=A0AB34JY30_PRYPA
MARHAFLPLSPRRSEGWKARPPCNTSSPLEQPLVSALLQTFKDGGNARQLSRRLHAFARLELLANADSAVDVARWVAALDGPADYLLLSPNVHEIRAYNRLARMARGEFLLVLQGDHCLPPTPAWLHEGLEIFARLPRLAMLGGQMGFNQVPYRRVAENVSWGAPPCRAVPSQLSVGGRGVPFMFVSGVNIGPLLIRREAFLRVGGFDEAFSCAGQPGIQLDTELSLQLWRQGYQVGLWYSAVSNGVGGRKTRTDRAQKRVRNQNDVINGRRCERLFRQHDLAVVDAANKQLEWLPDPEAARDDRLLSLGMRSPKRCSEE